MYGCGWLWLGLVAGAVVAQDIKIDFEGPFQALTVPAGRPSRVTGEICPPLAENSSGWAVVDMRFSRLTDEPFAGRAAQRCEVLAVRDGRAQLYIPGLRPPAGHYGRLKLALRAPFSASLELGLRQSGAPWQHPWQKSYLLSPEWRVIEELLPPAPAFETGYALMFYLPHGIVDIDELSLVWGTAEELAGSGPAKLGNLLPTSTFGLGLPSPWSLASTFVGGRAEPGEPGPSGQPCLRLTCGYNNALMPLNPGVELVSPAVAVNSLRDHTISFWAKGATGRRLTVGFGEPGGRRINGQVTLTADWQRHTVTGRLPLLPDGFAVLTLQGDADFRVDGIRVEEGDRAGEWASATPVQLALTTPSDRVRGLCFAGQPLVVRVGATGRVEPGQRLRGALVHLDGTSQPIDLPLPANPADALVTLPDPGAERLGTWRLELQVVAGPEPVSNWAEVVLHRVRQPRHWGEDAPDSPFGIHINATADEAEAVKRIGFNWVRIHDAAAELTKWYFLERAPDEWDWSRADAGIDTFRAARLMILGLLDTAPAFRSNAGDDRSWFQKYYLPRPEQMDRWEAYCRSVVGRYKDRISEWEVWNEPYVTSFFRLGRTDGQFTSGAPADYLPLLRSAWRAVRETDPRAKVIWASQPGNWHAGCVAGEAWTASDEASLHAYIMAQPRAWPNFAERVASLRGALPEVARAIPLQNTEGGAGASNLQHFLARTPPAEKLGYTRLMAEYLVRYQVACLAAGIRRFYLYTWHKWYWRPDWNLRLPDGSLPPSATALSNLFWHLEGRAPVGSRQLRDGFRAELFAGGGETVAVVLKTTADRRSLTCPAGATVRDLYGNPVPAGTALLDGVWYVGGAAPTGVLDQWR